MKSHICKGQLVGKAPPIPKGDWANRKAAEMGSINYDIMCRLSRENSEK